ncbi:MAG: U32 family peptidase [Paludibacteraceae bacterium]|nr:U32 family peptidase [Paludibacteraceae bacterium]
MAPVGSWESLHAAIQAGADSVYFGIEQLNMRSRSSANFTCDDMRTIVHTCREAGVRTYLTLNTVIYQNDLQQMRQIVDAAREAGLTAIIASDVAVMQYAASQGVEVHLSTQLNIANVDALRFYARWADVVVLARELDLNQVREIHQAIIDQDIRGPHGALMQIEMFCHGALCMAVSGKCYLSLHEHNMSANRGACMQVCRRAYTVRDKESDIELDVTNPYIMSPKDLKTIHFINKMLQAGVNVFKIEGRARGPEYVAIVVSCYREAVQACLDGTYDEQHIAAWDERLRKVYNRDFWDGYYLGQRLGEWTHRYGSQATRRKEFVGRCTNYFQRIGVAEFHVESQPISVGEEYLVTGETTGAVMGTVGELRLDLNAVPRVDKGDIFSMKTDRPIRRGDRLYAMRVVTDDSLV